MSEEIGRGIQRAYTMLGLKAGASITEVSKAYYSKIYENPEKKPQYDYARDILYLHLMKYIDPITEANEPTRRIRRQIASTAYTPDLRRTAIVAVAGVPDENSELTYGGKEELKYLTELMFKREREIQILDTEEQVNMTQMSSEYIKRLSQYRLNLSEFWVNLFERVWLKRNVERAEMVLKTPDIAAGILDWEGPETERYNGADLFYGLKDMFRRESKGESFEEWYQLRSKAFEKRRTTAQQGRGSHGRGLRKTVKVPKEPPAAQTPDETWPSEIKQAWYVLKSLDRLPVMQDDAGDIGNAIYVAYLTTTIPGERRPRMSFARWYSGVLTRLNGKTSDKAWAPEEPKSGAVYIPEEPESDTGDIPEEPEKHTEQRENEQISIERLAEEGEGYIYPQESVDWGLLVGANKNKLEVLSTAVIIMAKLSAGETIEETKKLLEGKPSNFISSVAYILLEVHPQGPQFYIEAYYKGIPEELEGQIKDEDINIAGHFRERGIVGKLGIAKRVLATQLKNEEYESRQDTPTDIEEVIEYLNNDIARLTAIQKKLAGPDSLEDNGGGSGNR